MPFGTHGKRLWIQDETGRFEALRPGPGHNGRTRGPGEPDWWVVAKDKNWTPPEPPSLLGLGAAPAAQGAGGPVKTGAGGHPQPYGWHGYYGASGGRPGTDNEDWRLKEKRFDPQRLVRRAREELGSQEWKPTKNRFGNDAHHCNRFVGQMLEREGARAPHAGGTAGAVLGAERSDRLHDMTGGALGGQHPSAEQWTRPMQGFCIVTDPQPGDVASDGSHMGIVSAPGKTISASSKTGMVVENDWGFRPSQAGNVVFQRWIAPGDGRRQ